MIPSNARHTFLSDEYGVSPDGVVWSKAGKPLKPSVNPRGYEIVNLMIDGKRKGVSVHTLVARAFCDGYFDGAQVNHKNGIKTDNRSDNLEWVTPLENTQHSIHVLGNTMVGASNPKAKAITATNIKNGTAIHFGSLADAAKYFQFGKRYDVVKNGIWRAVNGIRKSYCGWRFFYT